MIAYLLRGAVGESALELEQGAADLVLEGGLALLVVDGVGGMGGMGGARGLRAGAAEEATLAAGGGGGSAAAASDRHVGGLLWIWTKSCCLGLCRMGVLADAS